MNVTKTIDFFHFLGILLAILVIPLIFHVGHQNIVLYKSIAAEVIAYALLGLWFVEAFESGKFKLPKNILNIPIIIYFLWSIATVFISSQFWYASLEELARLLAVIVVFFVVQRTVRTKKRFRWVMGSLMIVCFLTAVLGILQYYNISLIQWGQTVIVSTFGNKNFLSGFIVITFPIMVCYGIAIQRIGLKIMGFGIATLQLYAIFLTYNRTGIISLIIGGLIIVFVSLIFMKNIYHQWSTKKILIPVATLLIISIIGGYYTIPERYEERFTEAIDLQQGTSRVRWIMWSGATKAAFDKPIFGHGYGTFQQVFPNYRPSMYHRFRVSHNTRHAHNEYLEQLMEVGVIGLSLFLIIFCMTLYRVYYFLKSDAPQFYQWIVIGLSVGLFSSLVQNIASVNLRWMSTTFTFWLTLALIPTIIKQVNNDDFISLDTRTVKRGNTLRITVYLSILLLFFGAFYGNYRRLAADYSLKQLNMALAGVRKNQASWRLVDQIASKSKSANPYHLSTLYKTGYSHIARKQYKKGLKNYRRIINIAPNYAQIHNNMGISNIKIGHKGAGLAHFEWAALLEDNVRNHLNLVQRYSRNNDYKWAAKHAFDLDYLAVEMGRDFAHRVAKKAEQENFGSIDSIKKEYQKLLKDRNKAFFSVSNNIKNSQLGTYYQMRTSIETRQPELAVKSLNMQRKQGKRIKPTTLLAVATNPSPFSDENQQIDNPKRFLLVTANKLADQYGEKNKLYYLAQAYIHWKFGNPEKARSVIEQKSKELPDTPVVQRMLHNIK